MSPRMSPAHEEARREEILEAAYRCFSARGLRNTTMKDVADEAGLSAGALYRYFEGKEALFRELATRAAGRRGAALAGLEEASGPEGLASVVAGMMESLEGPGAERSVRLDVRLWAEALDDPDVARAVRSALASVREPVADHVRLEREAGRVPDTLDPEAVGRVVVSLLVGLELQRAHEDGGEGDRAQRAYREVVRALLTGLGSG